MKEACGRRAAFAGRFAVVVWTGPFLEQSIVQQTIERSIQVPRQDGVAIGLSQRLHERAAVAASVRQRNEDAIRQILQRQEVGGVSKDLEGAAAHGWRTLLTKCD